MGEIHGGPRNLQLAEPIRNPEPDGHDDTVRLVDAGHVRLRHGARR